jgi:hypothetical protein
MALEEIRDEKEEANQENVQKNDVEMLSEKNSEIKPVNEIPVQDLCKTNFDEEKFEAEMQAQRDLEISLSEFWEEHVDGVYVDKVKDDDRELLQIKKVWQAMPNLVPSEANDSEAQV